MRGLLLCLIESEKFSLVSLHGNPGGRSGERWHAWRSSSPRCCEGRGGQRKAQEGQEKEETAAQDQKAGKDGGGEETREARTSRASELVFERDHRRRSKQGRRLCRKGRAVLQMWPTKNLEKNLLAFGESSQRAPLCGQRCSAEVYAGKEDSLVVVVSAATVVSSACPSCGVQLSFAF